METIIVKNGRIFRCRLRWLWIWMLQFAAVLAAALLLSLSMWLGGVAYKICMWAVMPAVGAVSACLATKAGLLNYAAWIAPPLMLILGHSLLWAYAPNPGPILVCAFVSLVGAATGEVMKRQGRKK